MPVVALVLGVVFRNESIAPLAVIGSLLVIVGALLASRREAGSTRRVAPADIADDAP
jgi:drug/metabolite transporter (DMT)-like permease